MPRAVNHSKLDAAIRSALKSFRSKPDERVPFEEIEPHIQQKPRRHPFKEFSFSMNSFIGAFSLSSFVSKDAFFVFAKKWAVTAYIVAGTTAVGTGGYYLIDSFTYQNELSATETKTTPAHVNKGRFSLVNELAGNMLMLFKNTPNIIQSVTTVTGQVANASQYVPQTPVQQTTNYLAETTRPASTTSNPSATNTETISNDAQAEPVQLKIADNGATQTEGFDFSSDPGTTTDEGNSKDQLSNPENASDTAESSDPAITEDANAKSKNSALEAKKKDTKAATKSKKRKRTFFSKSALQH